MPISSVALSSSLLRQMTLLPGKSPMSSVAYALCIIASRIRPSASSRIAPQTAPLFMAIGMHCLGCPSSRGETVEEACMVHGVDADAFLAQVNRFIEASEEAEKAK